jgi:hypothetical protein
MESDDISDSPSGISSTLSEPALCRSSPDGTPTKHDPALYCSDGLLYARRNERQNIINQSDVNEDEDFSKYIEDEDYVPRAAVSSSAVQRRVNRKKAKSKYCRSYERQADGTAVLIANKSIKDKILGFFSGKDMKHTQTTHEKPEKHGTRAERTHYKKSPNSPGPTIHSFTFSDTKIGGADLAARDGKPSAVTMGVWPPQAPPNYQAKRKLTSSSLNSEVAFKANANCARSRDTISDQVGTQLDTPEQSGEFKLKNIPDPSLPQFINREGSMLTLGSDGDKSSSVKCNGVMSANAFVVDGQGDGVVGQRDWKSQTFDMW